MMNLQILSPEAEVFSGKVDSVSLPGLSGRFQVLRNHAPVIAALGHGMVIYQISQGQEAHYEIKGGVVEMLNNAIVVLVD
jgi:F-type H+-transporting ATPase subunit epsilon